MANLTLFDVCAIEDCHLTVFARGWCSKHYTAARRYGDPMYRRPGEVADGKRICPGCKIDRPLHDYSGTGRCRPCRADSMRERRRADPSIYLKPRSLHSCRQCGVDFLGDGRNTHYCSDACSRLAKREYDRSYEVDPAVASERQRNWRQRYPERNWLKSAKYRARKTAAFVDDVDRNAIFERDGWTCQICGRAIDKSLKCPDPLSPSIDHRIPLAGGGKHSYENCQAAHLGCNSSKGARVELDRMAV